MPFSHLSMAAFRSLFFYLFLFSSFFPLPYYSASSTILSYENSGKVSLGLYYESLCPYSADFIINHLVKIFQDDQLFSIVDLILVPWGNAKLRSNNTFHCQHGPAECLLNTVQACAISKWPQLSEHFPLIYCIEELAYEGKYSQWKTCFDKLVLDPRSIDNCYSSRDSKELELKYAAETSSLQPSHKYVPWVVVDGQPIYEDYENFISYICKAYKGTKVPNICSKQSLKPGSYKDRTILLELSAIIQWALTSWLQLMNAAA